MDGYTFEDYLKDFESDYLGFDGAPDEPEPELNDSSDERTEASFERK